MQSLRSSLNTLFIIFISHSLSPMSLIVSLAPLSSSHQVSFSNITLSGSPSLSCCCQTLIFVIYCPFFSVSTLGLFLFFFAETHFIEIFIKQQYEVIHHTSSDLFVCVCGHCVWLREPDRNGWRFRRDSRILRMVLLNWWCHQLDLVLRFLFLRDFSCLRENEQHQ